MSDTTEALRRAVALFDNPTKLAAAIGYSQHAVWHALNKRGQVSPRMAIAIHKITRGNVTKQQLRPDIFGGDA